MTGSQAPTYPTFHPYPPITYAMIHLEDLVHILHLFACNVSQPSSVFNVLRPSSLFNVLRPIPNFNGPLWKNQLSFCPYPPITYPMIDLKDLVHIVHLFNVMSCDLVHELMSCDLFQILTGHCGRSSGPISNFFL